MQKENLIAIALFCVCGIILIISDVVFVTNNASNTVETMAVLNFLAGCLFLLGVLHIRGKK